MQKNLVITRYKDNNGLIRGEFLKSMQYFGYTILRREGQFHEKVW